MKIEEAIQILERKTTIPGDGCTWEQIEEAIDAAVTALRSMLEAGEPLSLEQLREMDGKPVWCEDVERWAFVSVSDAGKWKDVPFALFEKKGGRFEWNVEDRELSLYSYPPAHIDRSKWEPCAVCENKTCRICINAGVVSYGDPCCECDATASGGSYYEHSNFCPHCGRPLTEEAWAELERRVRMPEPPEEG